jgi:DNA-binding transcriptional MerR regulator
VAALTATENFTYLDATPASSVAEPASTLPPDEQTWAIAEVAERVGVTAHTLRYYERIGLLSVGRDGAGRRRYTGDDIRRVYFITRLRAADLPISQIQRYFELVKAGPHTEPERLALLEGHRERVKAQLVDLESALATIELKIATYGGSLGSRGSDCSGGL